MTTCPGRGGSLILFMELPHGWPMTTLGLGISGQGRPLLQGAADSGFCVCNTCLPSECCSHPMVSFFFSHYAILFLLSFVFTQISFFASLFLRLLRHVGCPTSLSSASVCSPADPGSLLAPILGPGTHCAFYCTETVRPV